MLLGETGLTSIETVNFNFALFVSMFEVNERLGKKQIEYFRERLVELSSSKDESATSVAIRLQKRSRLYSSRE